MVLGQYIVVYRFAYALMQILIAVYGRYGIAHVIEYVVGRELHRMPVEIVDYRGDQMDFRKTKQVDEVMHCRACLRVADVVDAHVCAIVELFDFFVTHLLHAIENRAQLYVVIRIDFHEPPVALVEMQTPYRICARVCD